MSRSYTRRLSSNYSKQTSTSGSTEEAHLQTIHRGVTVAMAKIRDQYWIPTLRQLVKSIVTSVTSAKYLTLVITQNHLKD